MSVSDPPVSHLLLSVDTSHHAENCGQSREVMNVAVC